MTTPSGLKWWRIYATTAAVCALATAAAYAATVRPLALRRDEQQAQAVELDAREHKAAELTASLDAWQRQVTAATRAAQETPVQLQPATRVNRRLALLAELADECGLSIDEMQPGPPVDAPYFKTVLIRVVGTGTYPSVARFMRRSRSQFRDMGVRTFRATAVNPTPGAADASFQMEFTWFTAPAVK